METKNIILKLRNKIGLSQDDLAEKIMVTRQAVSRWENGELNEDYCKWCYADGTYTYGNMDYLINVCKKYGK